MECEWEDIVIPMIYMIWHKLEVQLAGEEYFMVDWNDLEELGSWLMIGPEDGHYSKGMNVLLWFVEVWQEK